MKKVKPKVTNEKMWDLLVKMDTRINRLDSKIINMNLDMNIRFDEHDNRFSSIDKKISKIDERLIEVQDGFVGLNRKFV